MTARAWVTALLLGAAPTVVGAQGTVSRIDGVANGTVRMVYAARAGVCGDGMNWYRSRPGSVTGSFMNFNGGAGRDVEVTCQTGPVRVVVVREGGETRDVRTYVGGRWKADTGITDLGTVSAPDAARWLLGQAERGVERIASAAMSAATLADSVNATEMLLRIVRDEKRPAGVRSSAMHWLGETAGEKSAARLDSIAYEPGDREIRKQAIYAVSRRPVDEAVPALVKMAESLPDRELRKTAVFWLARVKDPRAVEWITRKVSEK